MWQGEVTHRTNDCCWADAPRLNPDLASLKSSIPMGKSHNIKELLHSGDRTITLMDRIFAIPMLGMSLRGSGDVVGHEVTLKDGDGCRGIGSRSTYDQASANARRPLDRAHK